MLFTLKKLTQNSQAKYSYGLIQLDRKSDILKSAIAKIMRVVYV